MRDSPVVTPPSPSRRSAPPKVARLAVVLGGPPGAPDACRVEAADRVMRVWAVLNAADSELRRVSLPAEAVGRLQRQLEAITAELEGAVSGELAGELDRLIRRRGTAPRTVGELRIEYASLLGWAGGLVTGMLSELEMASASAGAGPDGPARVPQPDGPDAAKARPQP
jgi:Bacterial proteasome activator